MPGSSARLVLFFAGLVALTAGMQLHVYPDDSPKKVKGLGGVIQMKRALAQGAKHPAIFLGGGSNVLTGLRAAAISDMLHRPVYNLALSNELGDYRSAIAFLEQAVQSGDTLIYSSRGFHVEAPFRPESSSARGEPASAQSARYRFELPDRSVLRMLRPEIGANPWGQVEYLNPLGDFTMCVDPENGLHPQGFQPDNIGTERFLAELAQFSSRMKARGVGVLFMAPQLLVRRADLPNWKSRYQNTRNKLEAAGAEWLNFDENEVFITDPLEFCDSPFHPNQQRANMNSQNLAQQLSIRN